MTFGIPGRLKQRLPVHMKKDSRKFKTLDEIVHLREQWAASNESLVFTNGCFDILHVGHVRYLNQARTLGDRLVVAVNSDRSVRGIKGSSRPLIPERERMEVLGALQCVDFVFLFDDPTPERIIKALVPDVLVKGSDWDLADVVGRSVVEGNGGSVLTIPVVEGVSTSAIIQTVLDRFGKASR
ncbi:MAG: D-glycero-beta-D-manno-heptose 1-phosphate adenylyltransferase [Acidobacteriota bacterium]